MLVRSRPFGEWVVAYYDSTKTDAAKLLERLRANGCKKAKRNEPLSGRLNDAEVTLFNPVVAPGDFLHIEVKLPDDASADVKIVPPDGWAVPDGAERSLKAGVTRCDVQLPRDAKAGTQAVAFERTAQGGAKQELKLNVDVVRRVKD